MKQFNLVMVLTLILNACGDSSGGSGSSDQNESSENKSYSLASRDKLMNCTEKTEGYLVYIMDEEVFLTCSEKEWVEVDIKEKETVKETTVETKEVHVQYDDPLIFSDTITGLDWHHVGQKSGYPYELVNGAYISVCEIMGMRLPTSPELTAAVAHGMWLHLTASPMFLSVSGAGAGDQKFMVNTSPSSMYGYVPFYDNGPIQTVNTTAAIFCIAE